MVRKKTNVLYYASDGIEDDLNEWQLKTSSSTVVGSVYSLLGSGTDTAWETSTLYELDGNVFRPTNTKMFGSGGWLDDYGYGDVVYADCRKSSSFICFSSSLYPRLQYAGYMVVPVTETTEKLYLPVRKKTGIIMYADDDYEGDLYAWEVVSNRDGDVLTTIYSPLQLGTDTNWSTIQVYELNNNVFHSRELWGANGVLADYGYDDSSYPTIQAFVGKDYIRWTKETYPRLSRVSAAASYTIPIEGVQIKTYLPVRKKNGTTQYYI